MAMTAWLAKFCDQLDLLVGERPNLLTIDDDGADQLVVLDHRYADEGSRPPSLADGMGTASAASSAVWPTCFVSITRWSRPPACG